MIIQLINLISIPYLLINLIRIGLKMLISKAIEGILIIRLTYRHKAKIRVWRVSIILNSSEVNLIS